MSPRFSVVTVCYNAREALPATVASLREQTDADREWVVVDGASTDGSVEWLRAESPDVLVSEPDGGIYDAMNKAIDRAGGEWLFFLNAGDTFADASALQAVAAAIDEYPDAEIVYGDVVYFGTAGERRHGFHWITRRRLLFGDLCHQACFVRRALFDRFGAFDTRYRYAADYDWLLKAFHGGARLCYLPRDVARFHAEGSHAAARATTENERAHMRARYLNRPAWLAGHLALRVELKLRRWAGQEIS